MLLFFIFKGGYSIDDKILINLSDFLSAAKVIKDTKGTEILFMALAVEINAFINMLFTVELSGLLSVNHILRLQVDLFELNNILEELLLVLVSIKFNVFAARFTKWVFLVQAASACHVLTRQVKACVWRGADAAIHYNS